MIPDNNELCQNPKCHRVWQAGLVDRHGNHVYVCADCASYAESLKLRDKSGRLVKGDRYYEFLDRGQAVVVA